MTAEDAVAVLAALDDISASIVAVLEEAQVIVSLLSGLPFLLGVIFGGIMISHFFRRL